MQKKTYKIKISGRVQGVGYRLYVLRLARKYYLTGTVENLYNGQVQLLISLPEDLLDELILQLKTGPPLSKVINVESKEVEFIDYVDFKII